MKNSPIHTGLVALCQLGFLFLILLMVGGIMAAPKPEPLGPPPGVVIAASPDPQKFFVFSPSLAILPDGNYVASYDTRGRICSDGGTLLLAQPECKHGLIHRFTTIFHIYCDPGAIEYRVEHLVAQRVYRLALGFEDLKDHGSLREDEALATLVGKVGVADENRSPACDRDKPLAGKSMLNRLELTPAEADAALIPLWSHTGPSQVCHAGCLRAMNPTGGSSKAAFLSGHNSIGPPNPPRSAPQCWPCRRCHYHGCRN